MENNRDNFSKQNKIYSDDFLDGKFDSKNNTSFQGSPSENRNTLWEKKEYIAEKVVEKKRKDEGVIKSKNDSLFEFVSPMHGKQQDKSQFPVLHDDNVKKKYDYIRPKSDSRSDQEQSYADKYYEFRPYLVGAGHSQNPNPKPNQTTVSNNYSSYMNSNVNGTTNPPPIKPNTTSSYHPENDTLQQILHNESALNFFSKAHTKDEYNESNVNNNNNNLVGNSEMQKSLEYEEKFSIENNEPTTFSSYENDVEKSYFGGNVKEINDSVVNVSNEDFTNSDINYINNVGYSGKSEVNVQESYNDKIDDNISFNINNEDLDSRNTIDIEHNHNLGIEKDIPSNSLSNTEVNKTVFENIDLAKNNESNVSSVGKNEIIEEKSAIEVKDEIQNEEPKSTVSVENANKINDLFSKKVKEEKQIAGAEPIIPNDFTYNAPPVRLLEKNTQKLIENREWLAEKAEVLNNTFRNFGVGATVSGYTYGPTVTRFEIEPEPGIKVNKITSLQDDIKLSLAAKDIRIEAPIPGRASIGIEIPNDDKHIVRFRNVFEQHIADPENKDINVCLGIDLNGEPIIKAINKMPHALIAGATGSGKSVCINTIIVSILFNCSPEDVRLLLIDPKMVELAPYNKIPHLLTPVITDYKIAPLSLKWAVDEMEERYKKLAGKGVREIVSYNASLKEGEAKMPYIVIIIDELADLMMVSSNEVENYIMRIAQKARAAGIHLILATQRPSVNVITGTIKTNIPTRVAFTVSSYTDSRTILDVGGAERLLGKGDMLYSGSDMPVPVRLQGAFISDEEIEAVTSYVAKKNDKLEYLFDHDQIAVTPTGNGNSELDDDLFEEVCRFAIEEQSISTSRLQRRFQIGFNRAARLIDMMEDVGIVSEKKGSKPRDVLVSYEEFNAIMSNQ